METTYGENNRISDFNYSVSSDMPCMKHPNSSPIGICSHCLKDRLVNLVSSDQSFSDDTDRNSCSSYRNSCSVDVGSVGRISFLLENEKQSKTEQLILLRSSSNSVEIKKNRNGFWKIKRFFKKNREKGDDKSEISGPMGGGGVSRSRSLCSFRNGGSTAGGGGDDGSSDYRFSSAKISDVTGGLFLDYADHVSEPRKSENGGDFKNLRKKFPNSEFLCCSESPNMLPILQKHTTFAGFDTHPAAFFKSPSNVNSDRGNFFPVKESDFSTTTTMDDDDDDEAFIDLKLDLSSSSSSTAAATAAALSEPKLELFSDCSNSIGNLRSGSCRMNEYDRRMGRGNSEKGNKVWKWIFRKSSSTSKRDEINSNLIIKS
ncbi:hypothetical protein HAX54_019699 [Datura stramonium]|uniref:Uncharacterized protein n=1 Tax=Datura stramonium TaxID=4076 RepID=A0ABS8UPW2_DATST|nr:hypothetical protein [Datura stramonium]